MGHDANFDVGGDGIGFVESHCNYSRYVIERRMQNAKLRSKNSTGNRSRINKMLHPELHRAK